MKKALVLLLLVLPSFASAQDLVEQVEVVNTPLLVVPQAVYADQLRSKFVKISV